MSLTIPNRPARAREWVEDILSRYDISVSDPEKDGPAWLICRGYFRDSVGKVGTNDRGEYDDACFLISPNAFVSYNFNADPTAQYRTGLASLKADAVWWYKTGIHGLSKPKEDQYMAFVQAAPVVVFRDGTSGYPVGTKHRIYGECVAPGYWRGWFGINVHRGGYGTTSSLGCQTVPPRGGQWDSFFETTCSEMSRAGVDKIPAVLVEQQG